MSFKAGWRDFLVKKNFPRSYERWTFTRQSEYEEGRRTAAIVYHAAKDPQVKQHFEKHGLVYRGTIKKSYNPMFLLGLLPAKEAQWVSDERALGVRNSNHG